MRRHRRHWHEIVGVGPHTVIVEGPRYIGLRGMLKMSIYALAGLALVTAAAPAWPLVWNLFH
jgi:hypothetical protein